MTNTISPQDTEQLLLQLQKENEQLRQSQQQMSQALSVMAHDLRAPLQTIGGFACLMTDEDDNTRRAELYHIIEDSVQQMATLINDIISSTRLESGTLQFYIQSHNACEILQQTYDAQGPIYAPLPCDLKIDLPAQNIFINADGIRLKEILNNFLSNAAKYTDSGSVTLSIKTEDKWCYFHVTDTGIGFSPSDCERVFNKHEMLESERPGSGLGLYICRLLAHGMAGEVGCSTKLGKGSDFWVRIPIIA